MIKKVKTTAPWTYAISDLKVEEIVGEFNEKIIANTIKQSLNLKE